MQVQKKKLMTWLQYLFLTIHLILFNIPFKKNEGGVGEKVFHVVVVFCTMIPYIRRSSTPIVLGVCFCFGYYILMWFWLSYSLV